MAGSMDSEVGMEEKEKVERDERDEIVRPEMELPSDEEDEEVAMYTELLPTRLQTDRVPLWRTRRTYWTKWRRERYFESAVVQVQNDNDAGDKQNIAEDKQNNAEDKNNNAGDKNNNAGEEINAEKEN